MRKAVIRVVFGGLILFSLYGCAGLQYGEYTYYPVVPYDYTDPYSNYYYYNYYNFYYPYGYYTPYERPDRERETPGEFRREGR